MMIRQILVLYFLMINVSMTSQILIEGYVYESGNRGYVQGAEIVLLKEGDADIIALVITDALGKYLISIDSAGIYDLYIIKKPYFESFETIQIDSQKDRVYLRHEVVRQPGYILDMTIAEKNPAPDGPKDALKGALIEVYNNSLQKEELVIDSLLTPDFKVDLLKGNHYTILIRKDGFLSKRMEAFVDVEGCILCFEGIGKLGPDVSDNLTNENKTGTLLANVEMDRYYQGKIIGLNSIYYDFGQSNITESAAQELNKLGTFLKDNPRLKVELGSHTDARGRRQSNLKLSDSRAQACVAYLVRSHGIDADRITSRGYGESNLVNSCRDGVDCTDEEHRMNRRTELKILEYIDISLSKTLRQMKTEELMDQLINNLGNNQEIKVDEGGTLQNIIKQLDTSRLTQSRTFIDVDIYKNTQITEIGIHSAATQSPAERNMESVNDTISQAYSGYRIVIHFSRFPIPSNHDIYREHDDVIDYKTADRNHLYMIGDYQSQSVAGQRLAQLSQDRYENAYLVKFENGIRVE